MNTNEVKYQNAKKRVTGLRSFYIHLTVYVIVNSGLFLLDLFTSPGSFWFFWPLMGWGIGLTMHALSIFRPRSWLGADWEEGKIREIIENEE
jgi:hypothetical protein